VAEWLVPKPNQKAFDPAGQDSNPPCPIFDAAHERMAEQMSKFQSKPAIFGIGSCELCKIGKVLVNWLLTRACQIPDTLSFDEQKKNGKPEKKLSLDLGLI
jgi:hypothetical protein